mmetsp:Transcript_28381/g.73039  ORF Transcript_28381/g.73039 Transcript_28381/m.73039 type:complete len:299 (-) Transcript_28381:107-1003(-)
MSQGAPLPGVRGRRARCRRRRRVGRLRPLLAVGRLRAALQGRRQRARRRRGVAQRAPLAAVARRARRRRRARRAVRAAHGGHARCLVALRRRAGAADGRARPAHHRRTAIAPPAARARADPLRLVDPRLPRVAHRRLRGVARRRLLRRLRRLPPLPPRRPPRALARPPSAQPLRARRRRRTPLPAARARPPRAAVRTARRARRRPRGAADRAAAALGHVAPAGRRRRQRLAVQPVRARALCRVRHQPITRHDENVHVAHGEAGELELYGPPRQASSCVLGVRANWLRGRGERPRPRHS